jgi:hypothetical protein
MSRGKRRVEGCSTAERVWRRAATQRHQERKPEREIATKQKGRRDRNETHRKRRGDETKVVWMLCGSAAPDGKLD